MRRRADPCGRTIDGRGTALVVFRLWYGVPLHTRQYMSVGCLTGDEIGPGDVTLERLLQGRWLMERAIRLGLRLR